MSDYKEREANDYLERLDETENCDDWIDDKADELIKEKKENRDE